MKNKDLIIHAMSEIDDSLINESMNYSKGKRIPYFHLLLASAVLVMSIVGIRLFHSHFRQASDPGNLDVAGKQDSHEKDVADLEQIYDAVYRDSLVGGDGSQVFLEDICFASPWEPSQVFATLPVYRNPCANPMGMENGLSKEEMLAEAGEYADVFGIDISDYREFTYEYEGKEWIQSLTFRGGLTEMIIFGNGNMEIDFHSPISTETDRSQAEALALRYIGRHPELFKEGDYAISTGNMFAANVLEACADIYPASGSEKEQVVSYCLHKTRAVFNTDGKLKTLTFQKDQILEYLGEYPVINASQAEEILLQDNDLPQYEGQVVIARRDLVYSLDYANPYAMPYYVFYVRNVREFARESESGKTSCVAYYIPAVDPDWLAYEQKGEAALPRLIFAPEI